MDKPSADPERIKTQLTEHGLLGRRLGRRHIICPISAKNRQGVDDLLEMVTLKAEMQG